MLQLRSLRKRDGVTQTQLAEHMGITQATLSGWETEKFEIDTASLKNLAAYFNVSVDYLLGLTTQETLTTEDTMLSDKLKYLRKKHNITQNEFAKIFNISNGAIAMWETGKRQPDTDMLKRIATYFNVSIDYLLGLTTQEAPAEEKSSPETEELENIISYHRDGKTVRKQLSKKQMDAIHTIIETMKESDEDL